MWSLIQTFLLIGPVIFIWLMARLFFCGLPLSQPSPTHTPKEQIISGVFRTFFFLWFNLCGMAAVIGLGFMHAIAIVNGAMPSASLPKIQWVCLAIAAMPIPMGMAAAFAVSSKRAVILWGRTAYGFHITALLLLCFSDYDKISLHEMLRSLAASGMLMLIYSSPAHLGWLGLTFLFPKIQSVAPSVLPDPKKLDVTKVTG
jgi:hypothetical protein